MRKPLDGLIDLFRGLHEARRALQAEMKQCLRTFYELGRKNNLSARGKLKSDHETIRGIYLIQRLKGKRVVDGKPYRIHRHICGRMNPGVVYKIARDYRNIEKWLAADARRRTLNGRSRAVSLALRDLRFALKNRFAGKASTEDYHRANALLASSPFLTPEDRGAVLGAIAFDRRLQFLEAEIGMVAEDWRQTFTVPFAPVIRRRHNGILRVEWCYVEEFHDAQGRFHKHSNAISGGINDRWLRKNRHYYSGDPAWRKKVMGFVKRLRPLQRQYSEVIRWAGRLKGKVHRILSHEAIPKPPHRQKGAS